MMLRNCGSERGLLAAEPGRRVWGRAGGEAGGWRGDTGMDRGHGPRAAHLLEKQWAADTTQQVWTRLPAQKLFPM